MIKRVIWIIIIVLIGGYFVNSYLEDKAKLRAEKEEAEQREKASKAAIAQLVKSYDAVDNWEKDLSKGDPLTFTPILTVDLERLWLTNRPILFIGRIKDISTINSDTYRIDIGRGGMFSNIEYMFSTELRLALQCQKQMIDLFLKNNPDLFNNYGLNNRVAAIAARSGVPPVL
jgi:hypothetical protein